MSDMKRLGDNEESAKARYEIERATIDCAEMSLFIDDVQAATLARGNFGSGHSVLLAGAHASSLACSWKAYRSVMPAM